MTHTGLCRYIGRPSMRLHNLQNNLQVGLQILTHNSAVAVMDPILGAPITVLIPALAPTKKGNIYRGKSQKADFIGTKFRTNNDFHYAQELFTSWR